MVEIRIYFIYLLFIYLYNNEISMRVKTPMCQTRNAYLPSQGKAAFLVQRGRSAIFW